MDYRYTEGETAKVTLTLTLGEVETIKKVLRYALSTESSEVPKWTVRGIVEELAHTQAAAADLLASYAKDLANQAKDSNV